MVRYYGYEFASPYGGFVAFLLRCFFWRKLATAGIPEFVSGGRLLDVGCSWGSYLSRMAGYGWDVYGLEFNVKAARYARDVLGLRNISVGSFGASDYRDNFFDVVHMSMVLEHLHNPVDSLLKAAGILKPGGQLIVSVPDITGFEAVIYGRFAYTLQVPQHLNHFSPATITSVLAMAGFVVERIVHQNFDRDLVSSSDYLDSRILSRVLHNRLIRKTVVKSFVSLLAFFGRTSRMTVYARRQDG